MQKLGKWIFWCMVLASLGQMGWAGNPGEIQVSTLAELRAQFSDPPAAYRAAPLYVWNDDMQEEEIARQLDAFKAGGFGGVFVHPRPGLVTPYLSERWLEVWRFTADEAAKRGMVTYIYDENSYPSGFAGGFVPDQMPDAAQVFLHRQEFKPADLDKLVLSKDTEALYRVTDEKTGAFERVAIPALEGGDTKTAADLALKPGAYILYNRRYGGASPWYGGKTFVDLMRRDVTQKFLDVTFGAYDKALTDLYGKAVLACFTDEPQVEGSWSPMIPPAFKARWGYDILDVLPSIHSDVGDWRKVRHDYSATILQLFMENFAKPYYEACEERGIAFTGHVWEHGWPHINHNPDIMNFYRWQHWPGIDCLMNNYSEGPNAQFGNYRANKELDSIGNQLGRVRRLCETYGAGGWELTMEDVKRIGDHLYAGGVNLMNPHLSYYTLRGARKRDHPQSFSYQAPYWEAFHMPMDYFGRLSWALAGGKVQSPILVIQPTVTMWMYNWSGSQGKTLNQLGAAFQSYITELGAAQVAFDLGSEPVMAELAKVEGKQLQVGQCAYDVVILPPGLEVLSSSTVRLLADFAKNGGTIISTVGVPAYVDARPSDAAAEIKKLAGDRWIEEEQTPDQLKQTWKNGGAWITAEAPDNGRVYHYAREFEDGRLVFVINTSLEDQSVGSATVQGAFVEHWNAVNGQFESQVFAAKEESTVAFDFTLPPAGSALFAVYDKKPDLKTVAPQTWKEVDAPLTPAGQMNVAAMQPNVLTLDYVDLVLKGETTEGLYFYDAQTRIYQAHGFNRNPWDNAVQFEDELIQKDKFPADSGFELRYPFTMESFQTMPELKVVIEQGQLYTVTVNGVAIQPEEGQWWLDRAFKVYVVKPEILKKGVNVVATSASPFSLFMEPEPIYLLGDFKLQSADKGYVLAPSAPLALGPWNEQGRPFYADRVAYSQYYQIAADDKEQHFVELTDWVGTAARVDVNGKPVGYILWKPWRLDITSALKPGQNTVTVVVFGSLKNLLGPHHAGQLRGSAWPGSFWQHPKDGQPAGEKYDVIGYGLNQPFALY